MNKRLTLKSLLSATAARRRRPGRHAGLGADQAEVRARLRDLRGLPPRRAVGRRRDQEAHRRPLRDPGLPGLAAGQGIRHQPGPDAGHGGHHLHRPGLRGAHLSGAGDRRRALHVPRLRPLEEVLAGRVAEGPDGGLLQEGRQQAAGRHLLRRAPHHRQQGDQQARGHGRPEAARARCAAVRDVPEGRRRQCHADRLCRGLPGAAEQDGRRAGEPAADDRGEEVLRSAIAHQPDRPHHRDAADHRQRPDLGQAVRRRQEDLRDGVPRGRAQGHRRDRRVRDQAGGRVHAPSTRRRSSSRTASPSPRPSRSSTSGRTRPGTRPPTTSCRPSSRHHRASGGPRADARPRRRCTQEKPRWTSMPARR